MTLPTATVAPLARTSLILVRPQGPVNVGLCCRAAANMGVRQLRVVAPGPDALDPHQARPFACRATDVLATLQIYADLPGALADVDFALATSRRLRQGWQILYDAPTAATAIARVPAHAAVVFGSEADGLSSEELACCQATLALDLPGSYPSLNLSHAVAVVLWQLHAALATRPLGPAAEPSATGPQRRALLHLWQDVLETTGYFARGGQGRFASKLQSLVQNVAVTGRDVQLLSGMLKHWRREAGPPLKLDEPTKAPP